MDYTTAWSIIGANYYEDSGVIKPKVDSHTPTSDEAAALEFLENYVPEQLPQDTDNAS